jgi:hypothetical protein
MRKIFIVILLLIVSLSLFPQSFDAGISAGITGAQIDGDSYGGYDKGGFTSGGFVNYHLKDYISLQAELNLMMKGAAKHTSTDDPSVYKATLYYIDFPVLAVLNYKKRFAFECGPVPGYLVYSVVDLGQGPEKPGKPFNKIDYAILLGGRYILNESFHLTFRWEYSIFRASEYAVDAPYYYRSGQFNKLLALSVFYTFGRKKPE